MNLATKIHYYQGRVCDYLDEFGLPLRRRTLLFYEHTAAASAKDSAYSQGGDIRPVTMEAFLALHWPGDPYITRQAASWKGPGTRTAIAATRGSTLEGFCWMETGVADIPFFNLQCSLPAYTCYLSRLWIYPSFRGQGLGRAILQFGLAYARELGGERLICACVPHNDRMNHLFQQLGWATYRRVSYLRVGPALYFLATSGADKSKHIFTTSKAGEILLRPWETNRQALA
jgi:GNAT superfamily N-acetyltransferase